MLPTEALADSSSWGNIMEQTATDITRQASRTTPQRFCDGVLDRYADVSAVRINFPCVLLRRDPEMNKAAEPQPANRRDVAWAI